MADESLQETEGIVAGPPPARPAPAGGDGAFAAGPPPAASTEIAAGPAPAPLPDIALDRRPALPTRTCARCGSLMTVYLTENVMLNGAIPSGQRIYFRCTTCGKEIKIRSPWRLCLASFGCIAFCIVFWALFPFEDWRFAVFTLLAALYPLALALEFVTRMRYPKTGSKLWVRGVIWIAAGSGLVALALKVAHESGPRLTTGASALAVMSPAERKFHDDVFSRIRIGMTKKEALDLLGAPDKKELLGMKISWNAPGQEARQESKVVVDFDFTTFRVHRVTWHCRTGFFTGFYCELRPEE